MAGPMVQIKLLRATAKLLLVSSPFMIISGFLTAKPFILETIGFQTARTLHTIIVPLAFVPLLIVHSTAGVIYLLGREKRFKNGPVPRIAAALWVILLLGLSAVYLISQPAVEFENTPEIDAVDADAVTLGNDAVRPPRSLEAQSPSTDADLSDSSTITDDGGTISTPDGAAEEDAQRSALEVASPLPARPRQPRRPRPRRKAPIKVSSPEKVITPEKQATDSPPAEQRLSGSKLVRARCMGCHDLATVYSVKQSASEWQSTLASMISQGANLSTEERRVVLRHLISRSGR